MEGALALCRFVQFLAAASLLGVELYAWALAPPAWRRRCAPALCRICAAAIAPRRSPRWLGCRSKRRR